jgi:hypothetical protein
VGPPPRPGTALRRQSAATMLRSQHSRRENTP